MRPLMLAAVLVLSSLAIAGDAEKLPDTRAEAAKLRYEKALIDAKTMYHASVSKAEADYIVELEGAIKRATLAERFDAAKAIMGEKERIQASFSVSPPAASALIGRWELKGNAGVWVEFDASGEVRTFAAGDAGVWRANRDGTVSTAYGPGMLQTFTVVGQKAVSRRGSETREWVRIK